MSQKHLQQIESMISELKNSDNYHEKALAGILMAVLGSCLQGKEDELLLHISEFSRKQIELEKQRRQN